MIDIKFQSCPVYYIFLFGCIFWCKTTYDRLSSDQVNLSFGLMFCILFGLIPKIPKFSHKEKWRKNNAWEVPELFSNKHQYLLAFTDLYQEIIHFKLIQKNKHFNIETSEITLKWDIEILTLDMVLHGYSNRLIIQIHRIEFYVYGHMITFLLQSLFLPRMQRQSWYHNGEYQCKKIMQEHRRFISVGSPQLFGSRVVEIL